MTNKKKNLTISIDGLAGSGKTTISLHLSQMLGYQCISTGHMYRGIALAVSKGIKASPVKMATEATFEFTSAPEYRVIMNGTDITEDIKSPEIIPFTSQIAQIPQVRNALLLTQRELARKGGIVMEGRDVGTKILPNADWKFFLTCDFTIRLKRLYALLTDQEKKRYPTVESYLTVLRQIDDRDSKHVYSRPGCASDTIYHTTDAHSAKYEAIILHYYLTCSEEIVRNATKLAASDDKIGLE